MTTIVSAPGDLIVANSDGIDVRFAGLEIDVAIPPGPELPEGGKGLKLKLAGTRGSETQSRDTHFLEARADWAHRRSTQGPDVAGDPPTMPGVPVLHSVRAVIADDIGNDYQVVAGQVAGDGTEWDATWIYTPGPPPEARTLTVRFIADGEPTGKKCVIRLD